MNVGAWLKQAVSVLESKSPTARLDAEIILADCLSKDRAWVLANTDHQLKPEMVSQLDKLVVRRAAHEPLSYIRGKSEFFGREFIVTPSTLQPRPETETMIELLLSEVKDKNLEHSSIADIGTGSGAIAITAKLELPESSVYATEINQDALEVAISNSEKLGADVEFHEGDLLEPLQNKGLDVVLANLPYVPDSHTINEAAMQEPAVAIFGGADGLKLYRQLFSQTTHLSKSPVIFTESLPFQHQELAAIASRYGFRQVAEEDFIQVFRRS